MVYAEKPSRFLGPPVSRGAHQRVNGGFEVAVIGYVRTGAIVQEGVVIY